MTMDKKATEARSGPAWVLPARVRALLRDDPSVVYQLLIRVDGPANIRIASLGSFTLPIGWYVYSGSARRASSARVARHLRKRKCLRWHIDYLLSQPCARVVGVRLWPWRDGLECAVNRDLLETCAAQAPIPRFGSSDCEHGCPAHLLFLERLPGSRRRAAIAALSSSRSPSTST